MEVQIVDGTMVLPKSGKYFFAIEMNVIDNACFCGFELYATGRYRKRYNAGGLDSG